MNSKEPLCWAPWQSIQYRSAPYGVAPCCTWFGKKYHGPIDKYLTSEFLSKVKERMLGDELPEECIECKNHESVNAVSDRYIQNRLHETDNPYNKIIKIEYRPGNSCNLKCRTCKPTDSSSIEVEFKLNPKLSDTFFLTSGHDNTSTYIRDVQKIDTYDILNFDFTDVKFVNLVGGEPSIMPESFTFLQHLIDLGIHSKLKYLQFFTNATVVKQRWVDLISKFKTHVVFSIDGTGSAYEYVRTNATWADTEKNYEYLRTIVNRHRIMIVCSIDIIANVEEWIDWFLDKPVIWWPMLRPDNCSLDAIPTNIMLEKIKILQEKKHPKLNKLIKILKSAKFNYNIFLKFKKYHEELDIVRNTKFSDISETHRRIWNYNESI
jgi:sulfatase maturation enzyme AslB (radical SAM superfamily)